MFYFILFISPLVFICYPSRWEFRRSFFLTHRLTCTICLCVVSSVVCGHQEYSERWGGEKVAWKINYSVAFCSHRTSTNESLANCVNCHLLIWVCVLPFCALFATVLFSRFGEIMRWRLSTFLHNHLTFNYNSISFAFFFHPLTIFYSFGLFSHVLHLRQFNALFVPPHFENRKKMCLTSVF